jgi:eukaryotic-like serine/threonine-protein kinase
VSQPSDRLIDIAQVVADGRPVDWLSESAAHAEAAGEIHELQVIEQIAEVFRHQMGETPAPAAPGVALRQWGPLAIHEMLGSGSFGQVFRAVDSKLGRDVALKILRKRGDRAQAPADTVIREGQLLARVRDPNVMSVYGALEVEGEVGIWGEFLHGRTLAEIVRVDGPLSAQEAMLVGDAVCHALAAVHHAGLLHRDVKAQNVMREKGGRIVLMDFGLGRELESLGSEPDIAGTPRYMAPEVLAGRPPSVRSDLYAVGVLLFFLATGTFPVEANSVEELRRAHEKGSRRRLQDLNPGLPAAFIRVVERALAPDPLDRYESSGAMLDALAVGPSTETTRPSGTSARAKLGLGLVAAALAAAALFHAAGHRTVALAPVTFSLDAPPGTRFSEGARNVAALSPDGKYVAFVATDGTGASNLWLRSLDSLEAQEVADSDGARSPFWAPDSRGLAFFGKKGLARVSVGGVGSESLAPATEQFGGTWGTNERLLVTLEQRGGLFLIPATGGSRQLLMAPDAAAGEIGYLWPQFLPDGNRFIYFVLSNDERVRGIYLASLDGRKGKRLVGSDASAILAAGDLLYVRDGDLVTQPFDEASGTVKGQPSILRKNVATTAAYRSAVSASTVDSLVYSAGEVADVTELTWFDRSGRSLGTVGQPAKHRNPALSRDGRFLASQLYRGTLREINVLDLGRGGTTRLAHAVAVECPVWGPDGRLAYAATDKGWADVYARNVDGLTAAELLVESPHNKMPTDWSRDGRYLAYTEIGPNGSHDLWVLDLGEGRRRIPILETPAQEVSGKFSPDGTLLAFVSTASGKPEVYVQRFPEGGPAQRLSVDGGYDPQWTSARTISFLDSSAALAEVEVPPSRGTVPQRPRRLMQTNVITAGAASTHYTWDHDAKRVLVNAPRPDVVRRGVDVVLNWRSLVDQD